MVAALTMIEELRDRQRALQERYGEARVDQSHHLSRYRDALSRGPDVPTTMLLVLAAEYQAALKIATEAERDLDECIAAIAARIEDEVTSHAA